VADRVLTVQQPWADLVMAGLKDVENRTWPVPSTLTPWFTCPYCPVRWRDEPTPAGRCAGGGAHHGPAQVDGPFPLRLWIHAGQAWDHSDEAQEGLAVWRRREELAARNHMLTLEFMKTSMRRRSVLLGVVTVTGCHHADHCDETPGDWAQRAAVPAAARRLCSRWAQPGCWHWTLACPQPLAEPIPMKGRLGLWTLPDAVAALALREVG
jgi:hypothetical protein